MTLINTQIFLPFYAEHYERFKKSNNPFAYYTTAETALNILRNNSIWMRKPSTMNDYSEIEHGFECLKHAYDSDAGNYLKTTLNKFYDGISKEFDESFEKAKIHIRHSTFISCFTEHSKDEEHDFGRLSMWRAYGKNNGVALIFKPDLFINNHDSNQIGVIGSPVEYFTAEKVEESLNSIAKSIDENTEQLKPLTREQLKSWMLFAFTMAAICNKHSGFREEKEWRAITYSPLYLTSPFLKHDTVSINGMPQIIQVFNLENNIELKIDYSLKTLLQRIIIGPCSHPEVVKDALCLELTKMGFENAFDMIHVSNVPLRAS
jgi:predicted transcriptional regulator